MDDDNGSTCLDDDNGWACLGDDTPVCLEDSNGSTCLDDDIGCLEDTGWRVGEEENKEFTEVDDERGGCLNDEAFFTELATGLYSSGISEEEIYNLRMGYTCGIFVLIK